MATLDELDRQVRSLRAEVNRLSAAKPRRGTTGPRGRKGDPGATGAVGSLAFTQSGSGAAARTVEDKLRETFAINDFLPTGAPDDWRTALVAALAQLATTDGGTISFPRSTTPREIDNTGLGPIDCGDLNNIAMVGSSDEPAQLDIVTTDGTSLFRFNSTVVSVQKWWMDAIYINNLNTRPTAADLGAGAVFDFVAKGMSKSFFGPRFRVWQRNPDYSILVGNVSVDGGFLEGTWQGEWEYGTTGAPATVPGIKITTQGSLFGPIVIEPHRIHCHDAKAPFLWMDNTSAGNWSHLVVFRPQNVEGCRSGLVYCAGGKAWRIGGPISLFDSGNLDRDMFEMRDGSGGQPNYFTVFDQIVAHGGTSVGAAEEFQTVTSITQVAGTATVTKTAHGYVTGDRIDVVNAVQAGYNLEGARITVTDADHFTYAVSGGTATPATGATIKMRRVRRAPTSLTQTAGVATLTTVQDHNMVIGQLYNGADWTQPGYNIRATILSVPAANQVTFAVDPGTASPGTGNGSWARGAVDIALLGGEHRPSFIGCGGASTHNLEIYHGNNPAIVVPSTNRLVHYKKHVGSLIAGIGSVADANLEISTLRANRIDPNTNTFVNWAPSGYIRDLRLVYVSASQARVEAGRCRSHDDSDVVDNTGNRTIDLTVSGAGGLDTGSEAADTWYDAYLIWDSSGGNLPAGLATVMDATPVMPTGYDKRRRVGSFRNNGSSNIRAFETFGKGNKRQVTYDDTMANLRALNAGSATTPTNVLLAQWMPTNARIADLLVGLLTASAGNYVQLIPNQFGAADWKFSSGVAFTNEHRAQVRMLTSTNQRLSYLVSNAADDAWIYVLGYEEDL